MHQDSPLKRKTYAFALRVTLLCKKLMEEKKEYVLSKQFLKSATSIGANVAEAQHAQSRNDFAAKLSIALKEAWESDFWIHLLCDASYIGHSTGEELLRDLSEIIALLTSSIKTARKNSL
ncbi:four helix bundle protein [Candidatus Peregrinibacteria bacterium]|nr:four helix bundle protein [Candidatus Peregrinibacteria bacterium]